MPKRKRNYRKMNKQEFLVDLASKPWHLLKFVEDIDAKVEFFKLLSYGGPADKYAPLKNVRPIQKRKIRLSPELIKLRKDRDAAKNKLLTGEQSCIAENVKEYSIFRNRCTHQARKEKK